MKPLETLTFKQLRALKTVCETGSISAAANGLSLTPPAVHSQLKTLKENLNVEVVERDSQGAFHATPEGQIILTAFTKTEAALHRALEEIEDLRRGVAGRVVLGVVSTGKYFAPAIVARLQKQHPGIEIRLEVGNRDEVIEGLEAERIDIAIMGRPPRVPDVTAVPIGPHPHVLIACPDNPLAAKARASHEDILEQTVILREQGSGTRILAMRFLDAIGHGRLVKSIEMGSNETIKQAVIADLGIALISAHTVIDELGSGRLVHLKADRLPITRQWFVLHRADLHLTGSMTTILNEIRNNAEQMLRTRDVAALMS